MKLQDMKVQDMKMTDVKMQDMKMQAMKMTDVKIQDIKNAGHENDGLGCRTIILIVSVIWRKPVLTYAVTVSIDGLGEFGEKLFAAS